MAVLEFVNHASFIVRSGSGSLITDPWLRGSAFDNGWDLLSPSRFTLDGFGAITHLWLSHEHPDHFSPPTLMAIPASIRARITVLYQASVDRRVVTFCERAGFARIVELRRGAWHPVGRDLAVLCEPHDNGDSWIAIRTPHGVLLNVNDCVITSRRECLRILRRTGPVHTLASQFSYANWVGNRGERARHEAAAAERLASLRTQIRGFLPRFVLPFASFVYFSHEDNFYLNAAMTSVDVAADVIRDAGVDPLVLYPGDVWDFTAPSPSNTTRAIARHLADVARVRREGPRHRSERVPIERVLGHGRDFVERIRSRNGPWARLLPPTHVFLEDLGQTVRIAAGGPRLFAGPLRPDVVCRSDVLDYAFQHDWGARTADINGRFQVPAGGRYWKFKTWATLAGFNSRAEGLREILGTVFQRARSRLPF